MTSRTTPQRQRQLGPSQLTSSRPVVNVEEWEARAPLSDLAVQSVALVKHATEKANIPLKFLSSDGTTPISRPSTPTFLASRNKPGTPGRPGTPRQTAAATTVHHLHPAHPIQTAQQFYDWYALIDSSVAHSQGAHFRAHLATVASKTSTCDEMVQKIELIEREVEGMLRDWNSVEEGGRSLQGACEALLDERDKLLGITEAIGERMEYFMELDHATKILNQPGESIVLEPDFLYMVERVDICIDYLRAHRSYRESEVYLLRFQQCMTRAMTLIKMHFITSLRNLVADISKRMNEKDVSATAQTHLLYTRFATFSSPFKPLLGELEKRSHKYHTELSALLAECHQAYFSARKALVVPRLVIEVKALGMGASGTGGVVELTRSGCGFLKQLCTDEFDLYREFFNTDEDGLYAYLESLCDYLYDDLRPRILHEQKLSALCQVCTVLQALMVIDAPVRSAADSDSEDDASPSMDHNSKASKEVQTPDTESDVSKTKKHLHLSRLLQMVLQDAQTRLVFKAQSVLQSDVRYYTPKLEGVEMEWFLKGGEESTEEDSESEDSEDDTEDEGDDPTKHTFKRFIRTFKNPRDQDKWYPALTRTLQVLDLLFDFVKPAIFLDIAVEAIELCRQSLSTAENALKLHLTKNPLESLDTVKTPIIPFLFHIRHLLVLKELTSILLSPSSSLTQKSSSPQMGLTSGSVVVTDTLATVLTRTTDVLFRAVGRDDLGSGAARDGRVALDHDLRLACEHLLETCSNEICLPLSNYVSSPSSPPSFSNAATDFLGRVKHQLPVYSRLMHLFLNSLSREESGVKKTKTSEVLLAHVRGRIIDKYSEFRGSVLTTSTKEGQDAERIPTEGEVKDVVHKFSV